MEKFFRARWWDYHNRKFNLNGRICLETLLPFGFVGTILLKYINPVVIKVMYSIPNNILNYILFILLFIMCVDYIISFVVINNFCKVAKNVESEAVKDNTEEISNMVREVTTQKVEEIKEDIDEIKDETLKKLNDIPEHINVAKEKIHYRGSKIKSRIKTRIITQKEFTDLVKEKFANSWLHRRYLNAFPNLQVKTKKLNLKK